MSFQDLSILVLVFVNTLELLFLHIALRKVARLERRLNEVNQNLRSNVGHHQSF